MIISIQCILYNVQEYGSGLVILSLIREIKGPKPIVVQRSSMRLKQIQCIQFLRTVPAASGNGVRYKCPMQVWSYGTSNIPHSE